MQRRWDRWKLPRADGDEGKEVKPPKPHERATETTAAINLFNFHRLTKDSLINLMKADSTSISDNLDDELCIFILRKAHDREVKSGRISAFQSHFPG